MELQGKRIAVTGATGFLGRYIAKELLHAGAQVVAVVRNPDKVPLLARTPGVELRSADLAEPEALAKAFAGVDALVSNAALFSLKNSNWQEHLATNIRGTEHVLRAAHRAQVKRLVHVSSVAGYRKARGVTLDESTPQHVYHDNPSRFVVYPMSKAVSEQRAWALASELGLELTCVRPSLIYGAFDPNGTQIFRRLFEGRFFSLVPRGFTVPIVYAGDVAQAVSGALRNEASAGQSYNTAGPDASFADFYRAWKQAGAKTAPWALHLPIPYRTSFDNRKAERDLGFSNRSFVEGIRETLQLERDGTL